MIPIVHIWLLDEQHNGFWDHAYLGDLLNSTGIAWDVTGSPNSNMAVFIIPARQHIDRLNEINEIINRAKQCLVILTGDEEASFPIDQLHHPNMKLWAHHRDDTDYRLHNGYAPSKRQLPLKPPEKTLDWYFAGQITHEARTHMVDELRDVPGGELHTTQGFAQGIDPGEYIQQLATAKSAPCPPGPVIRETFREYEAYEAMAVPVFDDYEKRIIENAGRYPIAQAESSSEWLLTKMLNRRRLTNDIKELGGDIPNDYENTTVLIPTSPIHSHPSLEIIEETIATVRERLPWAEIMIMCDGVRLEQEHYRERYEQYLYNLVWSCNRLWRNVTPFIYSNHLHQAEMTKRTLEYVTTPTILFVEHDAPLCNEIPFSEIYPVITSGTLDVVRFNHENRVHEEHQHLTRGMIKHNGEQYMRTIQWSQRPHLASTDFYRRILQDEFLEDSRTMIEDKMHSVVMVADEVGTLNNYKVGIYHPDGNIQRSYHTDARGEDSKYEETFTL